MKLNNSQINSSTKPVNLKPTKPVETHQSSPVTAPKHVPKPPPKPQQTPLQSQHLSKLQDLKDPNTQTKQLDQSLAQTSPQKVQEMVSKIESLGSGLSELREMSHPQSQTETKLGQITSKSSQLIQDFNSLEKQIKNTPQKDQQAPLKQQRDKLVLEIRGQLQTERDQMSQLFGEIQENVGPNIVKRNLEPQINVLKDNRSSLMKQLGTATGSMKERIENSLKQTESELQKLEQNIEQSVNQSESGKSLSAINKQMSQHNRLLSQFTPFLNRDFTSEISRAPVSKIVMKQDTLERGTSKWQDTTQIEGKTVSQWQQELQQSRSQFNSLQEQRNTLSQDLSQVRGKLHKTSLDTTRMDQTIQSIDLIDQQMLKLAPEIEKLEKTLRSAPGNVFRTQMDLGTQTDTSHHSNWEKTKSSFVSEQPFMMAAMTDFREQTVRNLTQNILGKLAQEYGIEDLAEQIETQAFGSTNLTSDFDVSMSIKESLMEKLPVKIATQVVSEFNEQFRAAFYVEAGSFFDTNLYTRGLASDINHELGTKNEQGERVGGNGPLAWNSQIAEKTHNNNQDVLSLTKQRKFMSQPQWDKYVKQLVKAVPTEQKQSLTETYQQADQLFKSWDSELKDRMRELDPGLDDLPSDKKDALELKASNLIYTEKLSLADQAFNDYKNMDPGPEKEQQMAQYRQALGNALLFANEPYFSEGTLRHVVMNEQALKSDPSKLVVNVHQGLQSVNENFGDTVKEIEHMKHDKASFGTTAYKSAKYIGRFARGIDVTLHALGNSAGPLREKMGNLLKTQKALLSIEPELLKLRAGNNPPNNLSKEDYVKQLFSHPDLKHIQTVEQLGQEIEKMALQINIAVRTAI